MTIRGTKAFDFGVYEFRRLCGFVWPYVAAGFVDYLTSELTRFEAAGQTTLVLVLATAIKIMQLYFTDNSKARES